MRRHLLLLGITAGLTAAAAPPASAQLPALPFLPLPGAPTPAPPPPAPAPPVLPPTDGGRDTGAGEVGEYRAAGAANAVTGEAPAGPLYRAWTRRFNGPVNHPLLIGSLVIVNAAKGTSGYGSTVEAFDVRTGRRRWRRATPGTYFSAPIGADRETVVSVNADGLVRGIAVADGALRWEVPLTRTIFGHPPVVRGGVAYVSVEKEIVALDARTGSIRFRLPGVDGRILLDGGRLFAGCGDVSAFDAASGARLWQRTGLDTTGCSGGGEAGLVSGGRLYLGATTLDAATGATVPGAVGSVAAAADGIGYRLAFGRRASLVAVPLAGGAARWRQQLPDAGTGFSNVGTLAPVRTPGTIFTATPGALGQLDPATGRVRWKSRITGESGFSSVGGLRPGMAVGTGVVAIANGIRLSVFAPVLQPAAKGIDIAVEATDVTAGERVGLVARTGSAVGRPVLRVQTDRAPRGAFSKGSQLTTTSDRVGETSLRIRRNTRVRVSASGTRSRAITVYAYPRIRYGRLTATSRTALRQPVRITGVPTRGRRVVLYLGRVSRDVAQRLGSATLRGGRATVAFRVPAKIGRKDIFLVCVPGLARAGYGRLDALERHCGRANVNIRL